VELLQLLPGDRILSAGCGHGPELMDLSVAVGRSGYVVGVDLSSRMLDGSRERIAAHRLSNVALVRSDVLDYSDPVLFDAILFPFSLTCSGDPGSLLHHAWHLLAPGGRMVVLDGQVPPRFVQPLKPAMPLVRRFLDATVLGDPDMRPLDELRILDPKLEVEWFLGRTYFCARLQKSI
jgi:demethylmenaquinone methyltransferase/2-methoxy-6-polyprenyl-1,4-benzoquinol methylase